MFRSIRRAFGSGKPSRMSQVAVPASLAAILALAACGIGCMILGGAAWTQAELVQHLMDREAIRSPRVAATMLKVDRRHFINEQLIPAQFAYEDHPQPIGQNQTISAPHMHAACLELLQEHLYPGARVLDVGSGSGYLTACMALMVCPTGYVLGIEKFPELAKQSVANIRRAVPQLSAPQAPSAATGGPAGPGTGRRPGCTSLGVGTNWEVVHGNVLSDVLREEEPFSAIHVGAAAAEVPKQLLRVLSPGGRMVVPVGPRWKQQALTVVDKDASGRVTMHHVMGVSYVPLTRPTEMDNDLEPWAQGHSHRGADEL